MEIQEEWEDAQAEWESITNTDLRADSPEYKKKLSDCQAKFQQLGSLVNQLSLFSSNETVHDIATASLKFVLVPYYLALIEQQFIENRLLHLNNAKLFFGNFIQICESFEILSADDKKDAERKPENRESRDEIIARARREAQLKTQYNNLAARKKEIIKKRGEESYDGSYEEEVERELTLTLIQQAIVRTFSEIRLIGQEIPFVEKMEELKKTGEKHEPPPEPTKPARAPFTIFRDNRGELRAKVFRPHWVQPTMTIEEAADIDMQYMIRNGGAQSANVTGGNAEDGQESPDEDEDFDDDEKVRKQREWDDWCDDNPKGSGNTLANIG